MNVPNLLDYEFLKVRGTILHKFAFILNFYRLSLFKKIKKFIAFRERGSGRGRTRGRKTEKIRDRAGHCFVIPLMCALTGTEPAIKAQLTIELPGQDYNFVFNLINTVIAFV